MKLSRSIQLIRHWSILVDHDIPEDHIMHLAQLIHSETEKEKKEFIKALNIFIDSPTPQGFVKS